MKILVTVKRIPDPDEKPKFANGALDVSSTKWVPNAFDEYAVETALRLAEVPKSKEKLAEVVILSICPKDQRQHVSQFLAMGGARAVVVDADDSTLDTGDIAKLIAEVAKREGADMVVTGKLSQDNEGNQIGQRVAALLNWPQAAFAAEVEWNKDAGHMVISREVDDGVEVKKVPLPALVTVDLRSVLPKSVRNGVTPADYAYNEGARLASLKGITLAKRKKVAYFKPEELGVQTASAENTVAVEPPPARAAGQMVGSVAELVDKLANEAKVL